MSSAICFDLDQFKIVSSGNGLSSGIERTSLLHHSAQIGFYGSTTAVLLGARPRRGGSVVSVSDT